MAWIIGDIHGCYEEIDTLINQIPPKDELIFLGDYVDRGPSPFLVIERILLEKHRSLYLRGNHEEMFMNWMQATNKELDEVFFVNGGGTTLESYDIKFPLKNSVKWNQHLDFLNNLLNFHEGDNFIAVHAGIDPIPQRLWTGGYTYRRCRIGWWPGNLRLILK